MERMKKIRGRCREWLGRDVVLMDGRRVVDRVHLNIEHRQETKITHGVVVVVVEEEVGDYLLFLEVALSCHLWRL
jgi:hypothetical protein